MIHNDVYNSDVTALPVPLGIEPEVVLGAVRDSPNSPPAMFYDADGNAVTPYSLVTEDGSVLMGGIAIRAMDAPDLDVLGSYMPVLQEPDTPYSVQISYSFVDGRNNVVCPTNHGHAVMFRTVNDDHEILPLFQKVLDVDLLAPAFDQIGTDVDRNLLSIVYDFEGNLWFVTGGFHKDPAYSADGFAGYLERAYIDAVLNDPEAAAGLDAADYLHYLRFSGAGENCENGIAAHPLGCVILTNLACYLLQATPEGVVQAWSVGYDCDGGKGPIEGSSITGAGLAWGGGSSPTLTNELVLFTDNQQTVNLLAVSIETGEIVAQTPVLELGDDVIVSVENSVSVYAPTPERASVLVCNWYGAGSAAIFDPDADSSVQTYDNLYDANWRAQGAACLMPGIERVDVVRDADGSYHCETIWTRGDLTDTCMIKLSTASGYYYGYTQDPTTSTWGFFALDFDTGQTVLWVPVSQDPAYNNIAVGIMQGNGGNAIYCPTNSRTMVSLFDRFAYLPAHPEVALELTAMERAVLADEDLAAAAGVEGLHAASYLLGATVDAGSYAEGDELALRLTGLAGPKQRLALWHADAAGLLHPCEELLLVDPSTEEPLTNDAELAPEKLYEIRIPLQADAPYNLAPSDGSYAVRVVVVQQAS